MANELYLAAGTKNKFDAAATDVALTLTSLGAGAGRISAQKDWGVAPRAYLYDGMIEYVPATTAVVGEVVRVYIVEAPDHDATAVAGDLGTSDAAVSAEDLLRNCKLVGVLQVDTADTGIMRAFFEFESFARYFSVLVWNGTADAFSATSTASFVEIQPKAVQGQ